MNARILACRLLAAGLHDLLPGPATWRKNPLCYRIEPGRPSPSLKRLCRACDGDKVRRDKFGRERSCEDCDGRGWHRVDPMLNAEQASYELVSPTFTRRVLCYLCGGDGVWKRERCPSCEGAGKLSVSVHTDERVPLLDAPTMVLEHAIERRREAGSFHELELCLDVLRRQALHRHRVYWLVAVVRAPVSLDKRRHRWLQQADLDLAAMMPAEIRVPPYLRAAERALRLQLRQTHGRQVRQPSLIARRDNEIRRLHEQEGRTAAALASEFGLSTRRVQQLLFGVAA